MGILDRLSGHGYAILVSRDGATKELDFDTWGRESILGSRTIHKLVLPTINKLSEELDDTSYLVSIMNNHRVFSMHTAALMSACNLVAVCSQSTNPAHIFKQMINGCRAGLIEYGHIFSEFPEHEYREGIFSLIHQYSNVLLSEYQSHPGDRTTKLQSAAKEAINTLLVLISEKYPYENGLTVADALSHDLIRQQLIVIFTAIEKWVGGYVTHNAAKLLS